MKQYLTWNPDLGTIIGEIIMAKDMHKTKAEHHMKKAAEHHSMAKEHMSKVHVDEKQDKKLVKKMVKKDCMK